MKNKRTHKAIQKSIAFVNINDQITKDFLWNRANVLFLSPKVTGFRLAA